MTDDTCGYEDTTTGEPCQLPAGENGRCHIPSHNPGSGNTNPQGRPSKFATHHEDILDAAREGLTIEGCARSAGVDKQTLYNWLDDDEKTVDLGDETVRFFDAFKRARARGERRLLRQALEDPDVDSRTARFILERSFGYTKSQEIEHNGDGITINVPDEVTEF